MEVTKNFDWEETKRNIVVFSPNYNGAELTRKAIEKIKTVAEKQTYLIIIGNDGVDDDFSDLYSKNVRQLTIHRDTKTPRNGCFIRNYVIKRCKSELFFQRDAEVCIEGDFIMQSRIFAGQGYGWRAGNVAALSEGQTKAYTKSGLQASQAYFHKVEPVQPIRDYPTVREHLLNLDGRLNFISYFHYAYCTRTGLLQGINGYNEAYKYYGWEDTSMYLKLHRHGEVLKPDPTCYAIHLNHPLTVNKGELPNMKSIFASEDFETLWNKKGWGEG